jgi:hypothetical protein
MTAIDVAMGGTDRHERLVLGAQRLDVPLLDTAVHEVDQVGPQVVPYAAREPTPRCGRVEPLPVQDLGAVDVADASEYRLVHQQGRQRAPGAMDGHPGTPGVGVVP